jgi:L-alanine-DL-glutamate epimerase-like enolase superfamily enzyme
MKITGIDPFIMHIPVTGSGISDSTHSITHWGVVGAQVSTDKGLVGWGFTGTHAFLPGDRLIAACIKDCFAPILIGQPALEINRLWYKIARDPAMQWIGRAGITQIALAAIDTALWDLKAKHIELPLWSALGGSTKDVLPAYNTDIGWLSIPDDRLVDGARRVIEQDGFRGIKIKVGSSNPTVDLKRIEKVRAAIGDEVMLAVDGNGKWDLPTCVRFCKQAEAYDLFWFEEPMWYDDVRGHAELARQTTIPLALGEQLYHADAFQQFMDADAVHYVQPDITRLGGVSEFLTVADAALSRRLPIAAHVGDMGQVHVHLAYHHASCALLEYIPWIKHAFVEPIVVKDGNYLKPQLPGAGTTPTREALERYARALQ